MEQAYFKTVLGTVAIAGDSSGIRSISILDSDYPETSPMPLHLVPAVTELKEYLKGKRKDFGFQINPRGTEFQKRVWNYLREIPYGKTISYMDLSKKMGSPKAIRAVAAANGKNPIWIVIPCHRVIGSDGSLTGYAGGVHRKKWLLDHESELVQTSLFNE